MERGDGEDAEAVQHDLRGRGDLGQDTLKTVNKLKKRRYMYEMITNNGFAN